MSATSVTIRYDGPMLAEHRMDISDIAPALLGISELCKIANRNFNSGRANVQVFIAADSEHKCFQLKLHVVQTLWEHTKALLATDDVKTAEELAKILGLTVTGGLGFFQFLKRLAHRKITKAEYEQRDGGDVIRVVVEGDNNNVLIVRPESFHNDRELVQDKGSVRFQAGSSAVSDGRVQGSPVATTRARACGVNDSLL